MSYISDFVRSQWTKNDASRDEGLSTPDDILRYDNILYGNDRQYQVLDVYRPKNAAPFLPVIVSVHGGGWVYGTKETYQFYCMSLAQQGFAVVNFSYRLAPEHKYPASLEDTNSVFHWVFAHAKEYGFDIRHIFAVGDSAGAHILGMFCNLCTNPLYAKKYSFAPPEGFVPNAIAMNCGVYWMSLSDEEDESLKLMLKDYLPMQGSESELYNINVISHITSAFPPVFLMTAEDDYLKYGAPVLASKLQECNVPFIYRCYRADKYNLGHVFHLNLRQQDAQSCNQEEVAFFRRYCKF